MSLLNPYISFPVVAGGAVPVVESSSSVAFANTETDADIAMPTGTVDNDILVMLVGLGGGSDVPVVTGWNFLTGTDNDDDGKNGRIFWKRASSESGSPYNVSWTTAETGVIMCLRVSGCPTSGDPFDVIGTISTDSSATSLVVADITTTEANTLAICHFVCDDIVSLGSTVTGTGWSEILSPVRSTNYQGCTLHWAKKDMATAGSVGSPTFGTHGANQGQHGQILNLKSI